MAIFCTLGTFLKPLATIDLPKSLTFFGNFCKGVKIFYFSSEKHFWATFRDIWQFFLVTLRQQRFPFLGYRLIVAKRLRSGQTHKILLKVVVVKKSRRRLTLLLSTKSLVES